MNWLVIHIDVAHEGLNALEGMLSAHGVDGLVIDDETEFRDFLENNRQCWDYVDEDLEKSMAGKCRVTFYLEAKESGFAKLAELRIALEELRQADSRCEKALMTLENMKDADWENNWKQYYKPMEIGDRLLVIPAWEEKDPEGRVPLILEPGLTFGTGSHATTRLCLTALEREIHGGERVLDLGCGSGILSVAALKLGAASALAVDIDDMCPDVARGNARLNGIPDEVYTIRVGNILSDTKLRQEIGGGYDVVLANIVADVIIGLAPLVRDLLAPGGRFLCSGIIDTRAEEVAAKLREAGLTIEEARQSEGWFAYTCRDGQ